MSVAHLIITCAGSNFGLPIDHVIEVLQMVAPTASLPRAPRYCLGAVDYHGRLVPLLDLGARLGLCPPRRPSELVDGRIIITNDRDSVVSYAVDDVIELTDRPVVPLSSESNRFGGLVTGSVRWMDRQSALVLNLQPGVFLPVLAGEALRRALGEIEAAATVGSRQSVPPQGEGAE